jgi:hypothetical protein
MRPLGAITPKNKNSKNKKPKRGLKIESGLNIESE